MPDSSTVQTESARPLETSRVSLRGAVSSWRDRVSWPGALLGVVVVAQAVYIGWLVHDLYFMWGDDYDFLLLRGTLEGENVGWLAPHDDHWSTGTIAIYRALFSVFGMREYLPYAMVPIIFHLAIVVVLFRVLRLVGVRPWPAVVLPVLLAFFGGGSQAIMWNTTMGTIGALMFGYLALWAGVARGLDPISVRWINVLLILALMMAGPGITAVVLVTAYALVARGWRIAVGVALVPTLVFLAWYIGWGRHGAKDPLPDSWSYLQIPEYVWKGLVAHLEWLTGIPGSGGVLLLALVGVVLWAPAQWRGLRDIAFAGLAAAVFQIVLAASTRLSFGLETFTSSRYAYLTVVLLAPAMALGVALLAEVRVTPGWLVPSATTFAVLLLCVNGEHLFQQDREMRKWVTVANIGQLKAIRQGAQEGQVVLTPSVNDIINGRFRADLVAQPSAWDELPAGEPTAANRLDTDGAFFVSVNPIRNGYPTPTGQVRLGKGWSDDSEFDGGCSWLEAEDPGAVIEVPLGDPWTISIDGPMSEISTAVERDGLTGAARVWPVAPDHRAFVSSTVVSGVLLVAVNAAGDYQVCI